MFSAHSIHQVLEDRALDCLYQRNIDQSKGLLGANASSVDSPTNVELNSRTLHEILSPEQATALYAMNGSLQSEKPSKQWTGTGVKSVELEFPGGLTKEQRRVLHNCVKVLFPMLESRTDTVASSLSQTRIHVYPKGTKSILVSDHELDELTKTEGCGDSDGRGLGHRGSRRTRRQAIPQRWSQCSSAGETAGITRGEILAGGGGMDYCYLTVLKVGLSTAEAIASIARRGHLLPSRIGFCGSKDKQAVTMQRMSVWRPDAQALVDIQDAALIRSNTSGSSASRNGNGLARMKRGDADKGACVLVRDLAPHSQPLKLGHLSGNHFAVTLRRVSLHSSRQGHFSFSSSGYPDHSSQTSPASVVEVEGSETPEAYVESSSSSDRTESLGAALTSTEHLLQQIRSRARDYFPNLFGPQRFGSSASSTLPINPLLGRLLLAGDYRAVVLALLVQPQSALEVRLGGMTVAQLEEWFLPRSGLAPRSAASTPAIDDSAGIMPGIGNGSEGGEVVDTKVDDSLFLVRVRKRWCEYVECVEQAIVALDSSFKEDASAGGYAGHGTDTGTSPAQSRGRGDRRNDYQTGVVAPALASGHVLLDHRLWEETEDRGRDGNKLSGDRAVDEAREHILRRLRRVTALLVHGRLGSVHGRRARGNRGRRAKLVSRASQSRDRDGSISGDTNDDFSGSSGECENERGVERGTGTDGGAFAQRLLMEALRKEVGRQGGRRPRLVAGEEEQCSSSECNPEQTDQRQSSTLETVPGAVIGCEGKVNVAANGTSNGKEAVIELDLKRVDFSRVLRALPHSLRALLVNSYQSMLWNQAAARRLDIALGPTVSTHVYGRHPTSIATETVTKELNSLRASARASAMVDAVAARGMGSALPGDLVLVDGSGRAVTQWDLCARGNPSLNADKVPVLAFLPSQKERVVAPSSRDDASPDGNIYCYEVTASDVQDAAGQASFPLSAVVLPLPGFATRNSAALIERVRRDGAEALLATVCGGRDTTIRLPGAYRHLLASALNTRLLRPDRHIEQLDNLSYLLRRDHPTQGTSIQRGASPTRQAPGLTLPGFSGTVEQLWANGTIPYLLQEIWRVPQSLHSPHLQLTQQQEQEYQQARPEQDPPLNSEQDSSSAAVATASSTKPFIPFKKKLVMRFALLTCEESF